MCQLQKELRWTCARIGALEDYALWQEGGYDGGLPYAYEAKREKEAVEPEKEVTDDHVDEELTRAFGELLAPPSPNGPSAASWRGGESEGEKEEDQ